MPDIEHIALRLRKARLALDAINDRVQLTKDDPAPPVGGGQPAASSTTDDVHVAGLAEVVRRKKRVEALAQKSAELLAKYNPYHGPNGRFTGPGGATFVSTTNRRTTERMRTGQMSGGAGPKAALASQVKATPKFGDTPTAQDIKDISKIAGNFKLPNSVQITQTIGNDGKSIYPNKSEAEALAGKNVRSDPGLILSGKKFHAIELGGGSQVGQFKSIKRLIKNPTVEFISFDKQGKEFEFFLRDPEQKRSTNGFNVSFSTKDASIYLPGGKGAYFAIIEA